MADQLDTPGTAPVVDRRPVPRGVLPKGVQTWLMVALAIGMLGIIFLTGQPDGPAAPRQATQPAAAPSSADATYGPTLPAKSKPRPAAKPASDPCKSTRPEDVKDDTQEIVVCAQRVEGYRIDPDVLEAQRVKQHKQPRGRDLLVDNSCASVGPMGCRGGAGINLIAADSLRDDNFERAIAALAHADAWLVADTPRHFANSETIIKSIANQRKPAIYPSGFFTALGGLMSYAADQRDQYRKAAALVDCILRGAKPADTPVEQPTVFEFIVNMRTAKALGLTIPQSMRFRIDRVID